MTAVSREVDGVLLEAATCAIHARLWLTRGNTDEAKVAARQAAQLLDRAERILAESVDHQQVSEVQS